MRRSKMHVWSSLGHRVKSTFPVEACTAPSQCALSTRAGSECVAHAQQALCESDPTATVVSVDGTGHLF